jgi:hypothetical protein
MKAVPKRIRVGGFPLGHYAVDLFVWPKDRGGEYYTNPDNKSPPRIYVGLDYSSWEQCVKILLHETFELAGDIHNTRYVVAGDLNHDHSDYLFVFDHVTMGRIIAYQAAFVTPALPELAKLYKRFHDKKKRGES